MINRDKNGHYIKGHKFSELTIQKIKDARARQVMPPRSEEIKQKIRDNAKINPNFGMKGRKQSEEAKKKMREATLGRKYPKELYPNFAGRGKVSHKKGKSYEELYGKEKAQDIINRFKKTKKELFSKGEIVIWNKGKKGIYTKEQIDKIKKARAKQIIPLKDSSIEIKLQNFLKELGIEYYPHQFMKEIEHSYCCDIFVPSFNLILEADGNYFHFFPIGRDIDHIRTKELKEKGFRVLRLWESEIKKLDVYTFKEKLLGLQEAQSNLT